jgi:hypothetical protein
MSKQLRTQEKRRFGDCTRTKGRSWRNSFGTRSCLTCQIELLDMSDLEEDILEKNSIMLEFFFECNGRSSAFQLRGIKLT